MRFSSFIIIGHQKARSAFLFLALLNKRALDISFMAYDSFTLSTPTSLLNHFYLGLDLKADEIQVLIQNSTSHRFYISRQHPQYHQVQNKNLNRLMTLRFPFERLSVVDETIEDCGFQEGDNSCYFTKVPRHHLEILVEAPCDIYLKKDDLDFERVETFANREKQQTLLRLKESGIQEFYVHEYDLIKWAETIPLQTNE